MLSVKKARQLLDAEKLKETSDGSQEIHNNNDVKGGLCVIPVFKRVLAGSSVYLDPLDAFEELLRYKPNGTWLIRESRVEGMITISFKLEDVLRHKRFVYLEHQWTIVGHKQLQDVKEFTAHSKDTLDGTIMETLLAAIYESTALEYANIMLPSETQASSNCSYLHVSPYIMESHVSSPVKKIYVDPVNALNDVHNVILKIKQLIVNKDITTLLQLEMNVCSSMKLPHLEDLMGVLMRPKPYEGETSAKLFKDDFAQWLTDNDLTDNLFCPVELDLFDTPYVIESGRVINGSALFPKNKCLDCCPITRIPITKYPAHFEGYRRKLGETLLLFYDLVGLYQVSLMQTKEESEIPITKVDENSPKEKESFVPKVSGLSMFTHSENVTLSTGDDDNHDQSEVKDCIQQQSLFGRSQ